MRDRKKILILGSGQYARPFTEYGELSIVNPKTFDPSNIKDYNFIVFTGGADIAPRLYRESWTHPLTSWDHTRDRAEEYLYTLAQKHKIPKVGICRGSQFLTALNGGTIIQDVSKHAISGTHTIYTNSKDFKEIQVTSTHHQMMAPAHTYELLAYSVGLSDFYEDGLEVNRPPNCGETRGGSIKEPEVVWYPMSKSLAVQYHPEYMDEKTDGWKYFQHLLKEYIL